MNRTQRAIAAYLADEGPRPRIVPKLENPGNIKYVDKEKFFKTIKHEGISQVDKLNLLEYVNESPKANKHFWNYTKGNKKDFQDLIDNMIP